MKILDQIPTKIKVECEVSLGTIELLRKLAERNNCTLDYVLEKAVSESSFLHNKIETEGCKLLLEYPDGGTSILSFH